MENIKNIKGVFMRQIMRNALFSVVILLQIVTIVILIVFLNQHGDKFRKTESTNDNLYGLKETDFERLKNIDRNEYFVGPTIKKFTLTNGTDTKSVSVNMSEELASDVLVLVNKWQKLKGPEKEKVKEEIAFKIKSNPEVQKMIHNLSAIIENEFEEYN